MASRRDPTGTGWQAGEGGGMPLGQVGSGAYIED